MDGRVDVRTHILIVGWFNVVSSLIFVVLALLGFTLFTGLGLFAAADGEPEALPILGFFGCLAVVLFGVFAVPGILAGWGLLTRKPWSRVLGIVVAILHLFNIPIGTAFGIYALWVLSEPDTEAYLSGVEPAVVREDNLSGDRGL